MVAAVAIDNSIDAYYTQFTSSVVQLDNIKLNINIDLDNNYLDKLI